MGGMSQESLGYRVSVPVLLQSLCHFRRAWSTSLYNSKYGSDYRIFQYGSG